MDEGQLEQALLAWSQSNSVPAYTLEQIRSLVSRMRSSSLHFMHAKRHLSTTRVRTSRRRRSMERTGEDGHSTWLPTPTILAFHASETTCEHTSDIEIMSQLDRTTDIPIEEYYTFR